MVSFYGGSTFFYIISALAICLTVGILGAIIVSVIKAVMIGIKIITLRLTVWKL